MSSKSRRQLENWLKKIDVKGSVIDIGAIQNPIKKRVKSWKVKKYQTLDLKEPHENKKKRKIDFICDLNDEIKFKEDFDVAFCIEVSEYLYNPFGALRTINSLLKLDGILYISFHFLYGLHAPEKEDCIRYTEYGIRKLLKNTGFEIESIEKRELNLESIFLLNQFYQKEEMRILRNTETYDCGHLVKARKVFSLDF